MTTIALYGLSLLLLSRFAAGDDPAEDAPAAAQPVPRIAVGAIRWDAWHGEASSVGEVVEGTLGPKRYHNRLPFFAKVISDDQVEIRGDTQEVMDREIAYAHEAGLDYWAFVTYPPDIPMSRGLELYLSSTRKQDIHFCLNLQGGWESGGGMAAWPAKVERYVKYFADPCYQTVLGGRPLVYLYSVGDLVGKGRFADWSQAREAFDRLRQATVEAGIPPPYFVVQDWSPDAAAEKMKLLGLDAIGAYAMAGGGNEAPFPKLAELVAAWWERCKATGAPVVPLAMAGWDRRPRIERPHPWEPWQKPGEGMDSYYQPPTPRELAAHVGEALRWVGANPNTAPARAVLIYAWNENDEGGWLVPTLYEGSARLDALKEVLAGR